MFPFLSPSRPPVAGLGPPGAMSFPTETLHRAIRSAAASAVLLASTAWQAGSQAPPGAAEPIAGGDLPIISINDNRKPAGRLENGVLTLRLEARDGLWYPEGSSGPGLRVAAFAEEGKPVQNPGPLIRVPAGTEVRVTLRNSLAKPLTVFGLGARRGIAGDSVRIEPDSAREVRFTATDPGTYYYAGKTGPAPVLGRTEDDSQLHGAIVVDPRGRTAALDDRVFVIGWWLTFDSTSASGLGRATFVINGRSWPHTELLE